ncbi:MAG: class I tRNA ligase family protein, partial [Acidimicrobiales bacterium]
MSRSGRDDVEARWRRGWAESELYDADLDLTPPERTLYNLVEFPYPSAAGLHIGHAMTYAGADTWGRYQRMRGRVVFQPIGFDAFGINAENYALSVGDHPRRVIARTIANYRRQLQSLGCAWDWRSEVVTSDPAYYRWTQWVFLRLFQAGLAYRGEAPVVWCPGCLTVLAREQVDAGRCERCDTPVTERVMAQWFLRITAYADRLVGGLDNLDWPEAAKNRQRAWIGRSRGREIDFPVDAAAESITVFTTRPETLDGATFLAVPMGDPRAGASARHPVTGLALPVMAADYVLGEYGTGAVMGVPAHDERDAAFASAHGLPIIDAPLRDHQQGRPAVRYRLHDWLISRQRYWGPPIPIVHCPSCGVVPVPEDDLPVLLPEVEDFRPTGTGRSPLASVESWVRTACPACGGPAERETDVSDTFLDSAWYFLRYPSVTAPSAAERPWDADRTARWLPVDQYAGGPEHVARHHLYARFVTMALHDLGLVPFAEPFPRVRLHGMLTMGGAKMSKSRGNVVNPDELIAQHGADVTRLALLFGRPWDLDGEFDAGAVAGIERFLVKVGAVVQTAGAVVAGDDTAAVDRATARVTKAVDRHHYNVAIAALMELVDQISTDAGRTVLVRLLAPFAPHLAEELWAGLGGADSVHTQPWPEPAAAAQPTEVDLVVQIDGRLRDRL